MTSTLIVETQDGNQVYNYNDIKELHSSLPEVFGRSSSVRGLTVVVSQEGPIADMNIHVGV